VLPAKVRSNYCKGELKVAVGKVISKELRVAEAAELYSIPTRTIYSCKQRLLSTGAKNADSSSPKEPETQPEAAKEDK
jgi:helix-turn-helix, Psq domain